MLFFPTYFCSNPDTPDKYITFKGWHLTVNTETLASTSFTAANVFGSVQLPDPSHTYSVTVQHVCFAIHYVTCKAKTLQCTVLYRENELCSIAISLNSSLSLTSDGPCQSGGSTSAATETLKIPLGRTSIGKSPVRSFSSGRSTPTSKLIVALLKL